MLSSSKTRASSSPIGLTERLSCSGRRPINTALTRANARRSRLSTLKRLTTMLPERCVPAGSALCAQSSLNEAQHVVNTSTR